MSRFSPKLQVIGALLAIAVIGSALASAFAQVEIGAIVDNSGRDQDILNRTGRWNGNGPLLVESSLMGAGNIFIIEGVLNTSYLKTNAYSSYFDGVWTTQGSYGPYDQDWLPGVDLEEADAAVWIVPEGELHGQLPAAARTGMLSSTGDITIEYSPELGVFRTEGYTSHRYSIAFNSTVPTSDVLKALGIVRSEEHLQVPDALREKLTELAKFIVQGVEEPFDQANLLVSFLKEHYTYTTVYSQTPAGRDEVEWFLFNSKMGMCTHFNSAFVLLARCLDIPARICSGYLVEDDWSLQPVTSEDAHAFAEVRFGQDQWVIFDATPDIPGGPGWQDPDESDTTPSLYGWLYDDRDRNGVKDALDPALRDWTVMLRDENEQPLAITTTSAAGLYTFDVREGDYIVHAFTTEGYIATTDPIRAVHVTIESGEVNFGFNYSSAMYSGTTPTVTTITSSGGDLVKGEPFRVQGTVTSTVNPGGPHIQIYLAPSKTSPDRIMCGEWNVGGGTFDIQCLIPDGLILGDYQLIARYVGDNEYAASESDPAVTVWDRTEIRVSGIDALAAEFGALLSMSVWEEASGDIVPNAELIVSMDGMNTTMSTGPTGIGSFYVEPGEARAAVLNISYSGSGHRLNSSYFNPLVIPGVQVDILRADLVRNGTGKIVGRVYAGSNTVQREVYVGIACRDSSIAGGALMETYGLDSQRRFMVDVPVGEDTPLGPHDFLITLGGLHNFTTIALNVTAQPLLEASVSWNSISVRLSDDRGNPLPGRSITLSTPYSTRTIITDQEGKAAATMDADADCNCTIAYLGENLYLEARVEVPIKGSGMSLLWWALLPAVVIPAVYLISKHRPRGRAENVAMAEVEGPSGPYIIISPQLPPGMPLVWEAGQAIDIIVDGGDGALTLTVDGQARPVARGQVVRLELAKGDHKAVVEGPAGRNVHSLRLVDYRTEIAKLYVDQVREWAERYEHIRLAMAPREIQMLMGRKERTAEEMESMISLFEQAQYSHHAIGRGDYERMYKAVKGMAG